MLRLLVQCSIARWTYYFILVDPSICNDHYRAEGHDIYRTLKSRLFDGEITGTLLMPVSNGPRLTGNSSMVKV